MWVNLRSAQRGAARSRAAAPLLFEVSGSGAATLSSSRRWLSARGAALATAASGQDGTPIELPVQQLAMFTIWGANTGVGKTLASVGLANAARTLQVPLLYVKPVQTGFPNDSDARLVAAASGSPLELGPHAAELAGTSAAGQAPTSGAGPLMRCKVMHAWSAPVSPHLAVMREGRAVADEEVVRGVVKEAELFASQLPTATHQASGGRAAGRADSSALCLVETAGGVASPGPSGRIMCDVLRPLRLPCVLVGDPRLGGISSTVSAYESLLLRGYDVDVILLMDPHDQALTVPSVSDQLAGQLPGGRARLAAGAGGVAAPAGLGNADALKAHFSTQVHRLGGPPVVVLSVPGCQPATAEQAAEATQQGGLDVNLSQWLRATTPWFEGVVGLLLARHAQRQAALAEARGKAMSQLWWPFTQHGALLRDAVQVVDSRCGEQLTALQAPGTTGGGAVGARSTTTMFDACSSWWTQAVGADLQPEIARAVGYAAGRYLHVISPQVATQASLEASSRLLSVVGGRWASRVFFSDDGSTAIEIALKMAFRKYLVDHDLQHSAPGQPPVELKVVGLENAYHGDTLGAMECVAPSVFNGPGQAPWYRGRGLFFNPPYIAITAGGKWQLVDPPAWIADSAHANLAQREAWPDVQAVASAERDSSLLTTAYRLHIEQQLDQHEREHPNSRLAALIIEPLVQGAGGMLVIDPQFQRQLVEACRARGMPVIFDEVMTGLLRVGATTAASLLRCEPDMACYAKLMTAGVVPGAATLTSEGVFEAFKGESKLQALLHGHSYTAFPVGCASTVAALDIVTNPSLNPNLCSPVPAGFGAKPTCPTPDKCSESCGRLVPMWRQEAVAALAAHPLVAHVAALGTVFAAKLDMGRRAGLASAGDAMQSGYGSNGAAEVVTRLRERHGVFARPLGDLVYLMVTPTTARGKCDQLLGALAQVLDGCVEELRESRAIKATARGDGCVV